MPLPTNAEIEARFENPTAQQLQRITEIRNGLVATAIAMRDRLGDGPFAVRALAAIAATFVAARESVVKDPPA